MVESRVRSLAEAPATALLVKILLWPGILGTALLVIAMWYFWFAFDQSNWMKKALWFVVLFLSFLVGPAFYYIFVYRRNVALAVEAEQR